MLGHTDDLGGKFRHGQDPPRLVGSAQKEMAMNFDDLHVRARERGWTLEIDGGRALRQYRSVIS
jgi:hypothetical protein